LKPDDKPAFPNAPEGFDKAREGITHGKLEMVEYDSKSVGNKRKALVYTPPGYSADAKYPVFTCSTVSAATRRNGVAAVIPK
jgi:enterochelin esterase-like enzyme